jgi:hypothetical protein
VATRDTQLTQRNNARIRAEEEIRPALDWVPDAAGAAAAAIVTSEAYTDTQITAEAASRVAGDAASVATAAADATTKANAAQAAAIAAAATDATTKANAAQAAAQAFATSADTAVLASANAYTDAAVAGTVSEARVMAHVVYGL